MNERERTLFRRIAQLESKLDLLEAERSELNTLLVHFGFDEGINTLMGSLDEVVGSDIRRKPE